MAETPCQKYGKSKTWCVLPWIHTATLTDGSVNLCCVAQTESKLNLNHSTLGDHWNSEYMKEVRQQMLAGEAVSACKHCYEEEANGYRSHRVTENGAWQDKLGKEKISEIVSQTESDGFLKASPIAIDLRLGNTCNLQCIMCQPRESSKWVSGANKLISHIEQETLKGEWEYKKNIEVSLYEWYKNEEFWADLKKLLPNIREIIVGGGEPMIIKEHLKFIKECVETGEAGHIHLRYHTNMMTLPRDMVSYWSEFERVEIFASVDGIEEVANYIRYPSDWATIYENLKFVDEMPNNTWLRFLISINALNIAYVPDFLRWVRNESFVKAEEFADVGIQGFVHPGYVHWPQYLNPKVLPKSVKEKVTAEFEKLYSEFSGQKMSKYQGIVNLMNSEDWSYRFPQLQHYLSALDKFRDTDAPLVFDRLPIAESIDTLRPKVMERPF